MLFSTVLYAHKLVIKNKPLMHIPKSSQILFSGDVKTKGNDIDLEKKI